MEFFPFKKKRVGYKVEGQVMEVGLQASLEVLLCLC